MLASVAFGINIAVTVLPYAQVQCAGKEAATMHRNPVNQELANDFNFVIIPIVMAIVLYLFIHPLNFGSSSHTSVGQAFAYLFCF